MPMIGAFIVFLISHEGSALRADTGFGKPLKGENGGEWNLCTHLSTYGTNIDPGYDTALVRLMQQIDGETSLEFGSGNLLYSSFLAKMIPGAKDIVGIEPVPSLYTKEMGVIQPNGLPRQVGINILNCTAKELHEQRLDGQFDLVHSNEVLEHIPVNLHPLVFDYVAARVSKLLVFGMARIGQAGTGHIACKDPEYVLANFEKRGLRYLPNITQAMHKLGGWMPENRLVFTKNQTAEDKPSDGLLALARPAGYKFKKWSYGKEQKEFSAKQWPNLQKLVDQMWAHKADCNPDLVG